MIFLFRSGTFRHKVSLVLKATRQHARNLGLFALTYKLSMLTLRQLNSGKEGHYDTFFSGLAGGYFVFGRSMQSSVNQQIVVYIFARVALALAKLAVKPSTESTVPGGGGGLGIVSDPQLRETIIKNAWPAFASLSWAAVMYIFRWHPETIQPSLRSSMTYMWVANSLNSGKDANTLPDTSTRITGTVSRRSHGITNRRIELELDIRIVGRQGWSFWNFLLHLHG
jgi:hypothetical protein